MSPATHQKTDIELAAEGLIRPALVPFGFIPARAGTAAPVGAAKAMEVAPLPAGFEPGQITLDQLVETASHTYDLSVKRAGELNIPVAGSGSGSLSRRVVVHEWKKYLDVEGDDNIHRHYGYVIRFAVTVDNWQTSASIGLPFLSAKAQLGQLRASWQMQVRGLTGPKINENILPPQELNVETFVLGKQQLEKIIGGVSDPSTTFQAVLLETINPQSPDVEYWLDAVAVFALACIRKGRSEPDALHRLRSTDPQANDRVRDLYQDFGVSGPNDPPDDARKRAAAILGNISVDV